jgi:ubiquinone/menaquinone biosynthesis C-methylase UbiE
LDRSDPRSPFPPEIVEYYEQTGVEMPRLAKGNGLLEYARTVELLERYLPPAPAVILDVGGGPGAYACWLARQGYEVHLIDTVPLHVEEARRASERQPERPVASLTVGDARTLSQSDGSADAVLLFGPLYHLTEREDRLTALREAGRVLKPGGVLLAAVITRFATALYGLFKDVLDDPPYAALLERDLAEGQHRGLTGDPTRRYFTTSYLHRPEEVAAEIEAAGLHHEATLAIEGVGRLLQNLDLHWTDPGRRQRMLDLLRRLESEPSLLGASSHLMGVARKV